MGCANPVLVDMLGLESLSAAFSGVSALRGLAALLGQYHNNRTGQVHTWHWHMYIICITNSIHYIHLTFELLGCYTLHCYIYTQHMIVLQAPLWLVLLLTRPSVWACPWLSPLWWWGRPPSWQGSLGLWTLATGGGRAMSTWRDNLKIIRTIR